MADPSNAQALSVHLVNRAARLLIDTKEDSAGRLDARKPILRMEEMLLLMYEQQRLIDDLTVQLVA